MDEPPGWVSLSFHETRGVLLNWNNWISANSPLAVDPLYDGRHCQLRRHGAWDTAFMDCLFAATATVPHVVQRPVYVRAAVCRPVAKRVMHRRLVMAIVSASLLGRFPRRAFQPSRQVAFPVSAERMTRPRHIGGIKPGAVGERHQETLVTQQMFEHARQKARFACRLADILMRNAGDRQERPEPLRIFGEEAKRLNSQRFRRFLESAMGAPSWLIFAFP